MHWMEPNRSYRIVLKMVPVFLVKPTAAGHWYILKVDVLRWAGHGYLIK